MNESRPRLFPPGLWHVGWRYLLQRRWQSGLMVLGIALGVAVMVAIDLANASAGQAFQLSTESITGKATHQIVGGPQGLEESLYVSLLRRGILPTAAPVVTETVTSAQLGSRPLQLLGVDPFVDGPFRSYLGGTGSLPPLDELTAFLTRPGAVFLGRSMAGRYGLKLGDSFTLLVGGRQKSAFVAGLLDAPDSLTAQTLDGVVLADIATAQELTGRVGKLDRIDLILPPDSAALVSAIQSSLPAGVTLETAAARQGSIEEMTAAFRLNLTALSLLALVVGLFLIFNTMTFSVVQRREMFGTLRCLGVTRGEIFGLVVSEAFFIGLVGSALGIVAGVVMGRETVSLVTQTINDLYFATTVQAVGIPVSSLVKGGVAGLLATMLTAALPAWEAASVPPRAALMRSNLEGRVRQVVLALAGGGLLLILAGGVTFTQSGQNLLLGFGGTVAVVIGFAMLAAVAMTLLMRAAVPVTGRLFGLLGRMAPRSLVSSLSRTAVAVAALMVAVSVTIGVSLMIDSFRYTVSIWLDQTLQGDVYISVQGFNATVATDGIDPQVIQIASSWPGVRHADLLKTVDIDSPAGPIQVSATDNTNFGNERLFKTLFVSQDQVWAQMLSGSVLISEPLANRLGLGGGAGQVSLMTPQGLKQFPVAGIYFDYANSQGSLYLAMPVFDRLWGGLGVTAIGLRLTSGTDAAAVSRQLQDRLGGIQQLLIRSNQSLKQDVMAVFDRTFAITAALRLLATVVAFIGVLNTLLLLQLEKQREAGILRALGLTGRQFWELTMIETGLMGLSAGLLAAPTGYTLSLILIYVINRRSFGWTLQQSIQPMAFLQAVLIAVAAALLAGIYPAWRMGRKAAADAIRNE